MIDFDLHNIIEKQNNDTHKRYCNCCEKGEVLSKWKVVGYEVDRWHGITEVYVWRECPHCKQRMSF